MCIKRGRSGPMHVALCVSVCMYSQDPDSFHGYCQDQADLLISSLLHESIVIDD